MVPRVAQRGLPNANSGVRGLRERLFHQPLAASWELLGVAPEVAQAWLWQRVPAVRNGSDAPAFVAALEGHPAAREARWKGNAEAACAAAFLESPVHHARPGVRVGSTFDDAALAPRWNDVPGVPEA